MARAVVRVTRKQQRLIDSSSGAGPVAFSYAGHARHADVIGFRAGRLGEPQVLAWQTAGGSASGSPVPGFRRFRVIGMDRVIQVEPTD